MSDTLLLRKFFLKRERVKLTKNYAIPQIGNPIRLIFAARHLLAKLFFIGLAGTACVGEIAAQTAPGTVITNIATGALQIAAVPATASSNSVSLTVAALPNAPVLTKAFAAAAIVSGNVTPLTFTLVNPVASAVASAAFTDNLPSSLRLSAGATFSVGGTLGCAASVSLAPTAVAVTNVSIPASGTCTITVNSVTNLAGQLNASCVALPVAFSNTAANMAGIVGLNNQVTPQCLVVNPTPGTASLSKAFVPNAIIENAASNLRFTISNSAGNPVQAGIAFTDTLPTGLRLATAATASVSGAGCAGTVNLTPPNVIAVSALSMTAGTASCVVSITSVTNTASQTNASCAGDPAAFTNGAGRISGISNVVNGVTNQCLVVTPLPPPAPVIAPETLPTLTKAFDKSVIVAGDWTVLTFTLTPGVNPANIGGYGFDDILPAGLAFRESPSVTMDGAGCNGEISFTTYMPPQANIIRVRNISIIDVTKVCTIRVEGVTNRVGQVNPVGCGTVNAPEFTNTATRIDAITNLVNGVTPQCLRVLPALPSLTKQFADDRIYDGDATTLTLSLQNSPGRPLVSAISFVDSLPAGLRLAANATASIQGAGCAGLVNLSGNQIRVSNFSIAAGRLTCSIVVTGITNAQNQQNASCAGNPAAFTNQASSISGINNLHNFVENACLVVEPTSPAMEMSVAKSISAIQGYSPGGPHTISLAFSNPATTANARKRNVTITDSLPAGMAFVSGSLRVIVGGSSINAANGNGSAVVGARAVSYRSTSAQVQVDFSVLEPGDTGVIVFDVDIAPNLARETILTNIATLSFTNSADRHLNRNSNAVVFRVIGALGVIVTGQTIASANPGQTLLFQNIITNRGNITDTYDISLRGSTFPAGSVITLLGANGAPLADSNSNGVPDTGPVTAGGSATVVVRVVLPLGILPGGPYRVAKTARSIADGRITDTDDDILLGIVRKCEVRLEPDNRARVRAGASVTYSHTLTNVGNCEETIRGALGGGAAGWIANAVLDPASTPNGTLAGVASAANPAASTPVVLAPGQSANYLVVVTAPTTARAGDIATHTITVNSTSTATTGAPATSRSVANTDTTTVDPNATNLPDDIIRGFIEGDFRRPSLWAFIGRNFFIRADAPSCNAIPDVIERRTIIITGPNGEREEIIAVETGPNTGIFDASIPVRPPPVLPGNGFLEGVAYDTFAIEILGCGRRIATSVTLIDPNGVVFDSRTNVPVEGATVRIVNAVGGTCTNTLAQVQALESGRIVSAANSIVTAANGRFDFPLVTPGDYCIQVRPPNGYTWTSVVPFERIPAGHNILATGPTSGGSYGGAFRVGPETGPVILDIPVDPGMISGLFIRKEALRQAVELGDFADYIITINNQTGYALNKSDVIATDDLPAGFTYVRGSARVEGKAIADPAGGAGPRLIFDVGRIELGKQVKLTYRVRVGPGALQGDGVNRVIANYRIGTSGLFSQSNVASATVTVSAGVFSNRAYVVGKIFADCNNDRSQTRAKGDNAGEVGIPGVRLYMEDGTSVVTDAEGKYSLYGISPRTHVLKIDRTSLPAGITVADLAKLSNRNLGKGDSRFIDVKNGEIHKANFAVSGCSAEAKKEIDERRRAASRLSTEIDGRLQEKLSTDVVSRQLADVRALPASGIVGQIQTPVAAAGNAAGQAPGTAGSGVDGKAVQSGEATTNAANSNVKGEEGSKIRDPAAPNLPIVDKALPGATETLPLEEVLPEQSNALGFIGLKTGDVLPVAQTSIRVKGLTGTTFKLLVNGKEVPESRVGKRAVLEGKQLQAWEYIGVAMQPGENEIAVTQTDAFGNQRGESKIKLRAPGDLAQIKIEFGERIRLNGGAVANGKTPVAMTVKMLDAHGTPVTARLPVTLASNLGRWDVLDVNPVEPGLQVFVEGGVGEFILLPPTEPGQALISAESGRAKVNVPLDFLPDLREMIAVGLIEGVINLRSLNSSAMVPARQQDAFEKEISQASRSFNDGKYQGAARAALFLKGKIKGEYLLTVAYDSDKDTKERLFRDIQPDEFYPVYGDSSVRAFDAQSTGRFYLRVDHKKSYLLYGDFNTATGAENRQLSNYNRSLTGFRQHFESGKVSANFFASRDSTKQMIDEFSANGTSGPFTLSNTRGLINSEKLEILTRDRNRASVILRALPLARFADYELEPLTGRILLKAPIASLDENLNPQSLRITYEVDQGGPEFWVAGADAQIKISDRFEVGGAVVDDRNPTDKFRMMSINGVAKIADKSFIIAEIVRTSREKFTNGESHGDISGLAKRIEFKHKDGNFDGNVFVAQSDAGFDNVSASLAKSRTEAGGKFSYRLNEKTTIKGELLSSHDNAADAKRDGLLISAERSLAPGISAELGLRMARDIQAAPLPGNGGTLGRPIKNEVATIRGRLTGAIPGIKGLSAYGEAEFDIEDTQRKILALGGEYQLPNKGRLYARHEFASSITGPYGLNNQQRQNATVFGISADYMKDGNLFSEYRIRDAISGGDAEAALGLRNAWTLAEGLKLQTGFERVHTLAGVGTGESTALTLGLEYTANPLWKGSTRFEMRQGQHQDSILSTVALATKLSRDFTFLGRNTFSLMTNKGQATGKNQQERLQLGVAYRDTDADTWNVLARVEHRAESDTTQPAVALKRTVEMLSLHANWQPLRPFTFSGRYAAKWVNEGSNGFRSSNNTQLLAGRAIWEFAPRMDVSVNVSTLLGRGAAANQNGLGVEVGFMVMENLWLSGGFNLFGYNDKDLTAGEYTNKGAFVRLRYKFDEDIFRKKSKCVLDCQGKQ